MQKPPPLVVTDLFPELLVALVGLLRGLASREWEQPTTAAGWTVKDVALHLLGGEIGKLSRARDAFTESPVNVSSWEELVVWLNQRNNEWVRATRRISPVLLCDLLQFAGEQTNEYFRSLDQGALGESVSWAGPEPAPVWLDVAREFTERWHHQQHIREAVGKPGLTEPRYLAPVLATFVHALPHAYRATNAPDDISVALTITGDSGNTWSVVREQNRWQLYLGMAEKPEAQVILPEQIAWRLFTRGISKENALVYAMIRGDQNLGARMLDAVSIIA